MEGSLGRGREKHTNTWRPPKGKAGTGHQLGIEAKGGWRPSLCTRTLGGGGRGCGVEMEARGWPIGENRARTPQGYRGVPVLTWSPPGSCRARGGTEAGCDTPPSGGPAALEVGPGCRVDLLTVSALPPTWAVSGPSQSLSIPTGSRRWTLAEQVLCDEQPRLSSQPPGHQWH